MERGCGLPAGMESVTAPERPHRRMGAGAAQAAGTQVPVGSARPAPARATSGVSRPGPPGKPEPGVCPGKDRVTAAPGKQSSRPAREGRRCPEPWPCMPHTEREHLHSRAAPGCRAWLGRGLWQRGVRSLRMGQACGCHPAQPSWSVWDPIMQVQASGHREGGGAAAGVPPGALAGSVGNGQGGPARAKDENISESAAQARDQGH